MKIIPVIDLLAGAVVHGRGGRRDEYRPIQSALCGSSEPMAVARALRNAFALAELYLADLDSLGGRSPACDVYQQLAVDRFALWIDAGVRNVGQLDDEFRGLCDLASAIVAGLETVDSPSALEQIVRRLGAERTVFSLDLKRGVPLASGREWQEWTPSQIADAAVQAGIRRMIVLDLANVGQGQGVDSLPLCQAILQKHATLEIIAGGGVRNLADLRTLDDAGCHGALVASALHDGRLTPDDVRQAAQRQFPRA